MQIPYPLFRGQWFTMCYKIWYTYYGEGSLGEQYMHRGHGQKQWLATRNQAHHGLSKHGQNVYKQFHSTQARSRFATHFAWFKQTKHQFDSVLNRMPKLKHRILVNSQQAQATTFSNITYPFQLFFPLFLSGNVHAKVKHDIEPHFLNQIAWNLIVYMFGYLSEPVPRFFQIVCIPFRVF